MKNLKNIIRNCLKSPIYRQADMGDLAGQRQFSNRDGLKWYAFGSSQFAPEDASLPAEASNYLDNLISRFKTEFGQYVVNPKTQRPITDFSGVIFAYYTKDSINNSVVAENLPQELQETMQFVDKNNIALTPNDSRTYIGSPVWQSKFGYAYVDLYPNQVSEREDKFKAEEITPVTDVLKAESNGFFWGEIQVLEVDKGAGIFLVNPDSGQSENIFRNQSPQNQRKFLRDKFDIGKTLLEFPNENGGMSIQKFPMKKQYPDADELEQRRAEWKNIINRGSGYILLLDNNGALYFSKVTGQKGRGLLRGDESIYLSKEQIENYILAPNRLGSRWKIKPEEGQYMESKKEGKWTFSEDLVKDLEESDSPYSFKSLRRLREHADNNFEDMYGQQMHTPKEGFKIVMTAPFYSQEKNVSPGTTTTREQFVNYDYAKDPQGSQFVEVARVKWAVLANEVSSGGRMNAWQGTQTFDDPSSALQYLKSTYIDTSVAGNDNLISDASRRVVAADRAMKASLEQDPQPAKAIREPIENNNINQDQSGDISNNDNMNNN